MDVPLTESGQYDDSGSESIANVAWATVRGAEPLSETGSNRGVVLVSLLTRKVVVKASQEPSREMFLTRLCRHTGVAAPGCRMIESGSPEYREVLQRVRGLTRRPIIVIQEYVSGLTLLRMTSEMASRYFVPSGEGIPVLRALGRIMALDVFTNNWDRVPLIHHNRGNFGNVILQDSGRLVAIDNAMTGIRKHMSGTVNPVYLEYIERVRTLVKNVVHAGPKRECEDIVRLRNVLSLHTPIRLSSQAGLVVQIGLAEMFLRLADFGMARLAAEKQAVSQMAAPLAWYTADLERIDLEYLGDVHAVFKEQESALLQAYKGSFY